LSSAGGRATLNGASALGRQGARVDVIEHGGVDDERGGPDRRSDSGIPRGPRRHRTLLVLAALLAGTLVVVSVRSGPEASDLPDVTESAGAHGTAIARLPDLRAKDLPPGTSVVLEAADGLQLLDLHALSVAPVETHGPAAVVRTLDPSAAGGARVTGAAAASPVPGSGDRWLTGVRLGVGWSLWRSHRDGTEGAAPVALPADRDLAGSVSAGAVIGPRFPQHPTAIEVYDADTLEVRSQVARTGTAHDVRGERIVWSACPSLGCPVTVTGVDAEGGLHPVEMPGLALADRGSLRLSADGSLLAGAVRDRATDEERYDVVLASVPGATMAGREENGSLEDRGAGDRRQEPGGAGPSGRAEVFAAVPVGPSGDPPRLAWTDTGVLVVAAGSDLLLVHDPSRGHSARVPLSVRVDDGPQLSTPPDGCRNPRRC
jgi:hypothetical protein